MTRAALGYGVLIGMILGGLTSAEAMRCGQRIIALGDTKAEVGDRCGEPTAIGFPGENAQISHMFHICANVPRKPSASGS